MGTNSHPAEIYTLQPMKKLLGGKCGHGGVKALWQGLVTEPHGRIRGKSLLKLSNFEADNVSKSPKILTLLPFLYFLFFCLSFFFSFGGG